VEVDTVLAAAEVDTVLAAAEVDTVLAAAEVDTVLAAAEVDCVDDEVEQHPQAKMMKASVIVRAIILMAND